MSKRKIVWETHDEEKGTGSRLVFTEDEELIVESYCEHAALGEPIWVQARENEVLFAYREALLLFLKKENNE
jgi:hypothetical protein